ncbi:MAG: hypothetical protein F9K32_03175 [Desulfobulbaceae bacterium]|nr:MAG: hypothetical protein F9K32_03175 [Desulfobulbaceae bacterium]
MNTAKMVRRISTFISVAALMMALGGCSGKGQNQPAPAAGDLPPLATSIGSFGDLELPVEMKIDQDKTMSINTESFKGGILHYTGRVEINSLKDFIVASMRNNKWKLVGEASYEYTLLAFTKPNRTCMIVLDEGLGGSLGKTHATLYVTADLSAAGNVNPFGESTMQ